MQHDFLRGRFGPHEHVAGRPLRREFELPDPRGRGRGIRPLRVVHPCDDAVAAGGGQASLIGQAIPLPVDLCACAGVDGDGHAALVHHAHAPLSGTAEAARHTDLPGAEGIADELQSINADRIGHQADVVHVDGRGMGRARHVKVQLSEAREVEV